jgi:ABC-type Zn2+ transport system substrate-binding protein/surface adhesin
MTETYQTHLKLEQQKAAMRAKFLSYAKKLVKTDPEYAKNLEAHIEDLVTWYSENNREMKQGELREILDKPVREQQ